MSSFAETCNVCGNQELEILFHSEGTRSITSLCTLHEIPTVLSYCHDCGHVQTRELLNSADFYDLEYRISLDSEDEDQLYQVVNQKRIYRCQHQGRMVQEIFNLQPGAKILDYGCAKGLTTRHLQKARPDVNCHLFDISEMYRNYWKQSLPEAICATYEIPQDWQGEMDLVLSFFAAEHISQLDGYLGQISRTLKPGGWLLLTVPDWKVNPADLLVVDHVNHFTSSSLAVLMNKLGWQNISIDQHSYQAGITLTASKPVGNEAGKVNVSRRIEGRDPSIMEYITHGYLSKSYRLCCNTMTSWQNNRENISRIESRLKGDQQVAIYGSGFYGSYIASCMSDMSKIACFLDANPHQQQKTLFQKSIFAPENLPANVEHVLVGLNPQIAELAISQNTISHQTGRTFTYLEKAKAA